MQTQLDPRIGALSNGLLYAFAHGYAQPETKGALQEVERALGIGATPVPKAAKVFKTFDVVMRFAHPAWDEVDGIRYHGIRASSRVDANKQARRMAESDGHTIGRGRYWFTATDV